MLCSAAGQLDEAAHAFDQALAMDHSLGLAHGFAGYNAALLGRAGQTLPAIECAMRLDPTDRRHSIWFFFGGFAELLVGRDDLSIAMFKKLLERNPSYGSARLFLMAPWHCSDAPPTPPSGRSFRSQCPTTANAFEQLWLSLALAYLWRPGQLCSTNSRPRHHRLSPTPTHPEPTAPGARFQIADHVHHNRLPPPAPRRGQATVASGAGTKIHCRPKSGRTLNPYTARMLSLLHVATLF
jgi:tetratricopeptide (TPR) repeat protein